MCARRLFAELARPKQEQQQQQRKREGEIDPFWPSWRHASPPLPNSVLLLCRGKKRIHPSEKGSINLPGCNLLPPTLKQRRSPSLSLSLALAFINSTNCMQSTPRVAVACSQLYDLLRARIVVLIHRRGEKLVFFPSPFFFSERSKRRDRYGRAPLFNL